MQSKSDKDEDKDLDETPWFRRFRADGRMEPHVSRGDNGEMVVIDDGGWAASFKNGAWHPDILFHVDHMAEFTPVRKRAEVYRLFNEARVALGLEEEQND